ncbi:hypothetical protein D3P09_05635 [Paenibacillus pinisoli]|uniref:DUF6843 domain-containing protein n=1 Tax=Paenibacillus pinisoli TaxID=1276110 RepID=A0A3A6PJM2_9BACL|nr:hypothetical protein [Paenibacillus pinisoli]RJX41455.1 hypothetical protein D3P09_05635 [Paenibacillus pinisoli]
MKKLALIAMTFLLAGCFSNKGTYDLFLIPEHYEGVIRVTYNVPGAPLLAQEGEYDVIPVDEQGRYDTSTPMFDAGTVINQYYWVDREGNRTAVDPLCVNVGGTGGTEIDGVRTHFTEIEVTRTQCGEAFQFHGSAP